MNTNQQHSSNRASIFWVGLVFHLALGATLYHFAFDKPVSMEKPVQTVKAEKPQKHKAASVAP